MENNHIVEQTVKILGKISDKKSLLRVLELVTYLYNKEKSGSAKS